MRESRWWKRGSLARFHLYKTIESGYEGLMETYFVSSLCPVAFQKRLNWWLKEEKANERRYKTVARSARTFLHHNHEQERTTEHFRAHWGGGGRTSYNHENAQQTSINVAACSDQVCSECHLKHVLIMQLWGKRILDHSPSHGCVRLETGVCGD